MKNAIRYFLLTVMMISVMGYSGECFSDEKSVLTLPAQVDLQRKQKLTFPARTLHQVRKCGSYFVMSMVFSPISAMH